ncbi:MAG: TRAP transporter small permease [Spirochaetes bacterium]|nr:TRAP transporter small permease [Spirochaetota bacterium]
MKLLNFISKIFQIAASTILALMMMITVSDVIMRYFFNKPILGTTELTENMMVIIVFFALAWCALKGDHLKVDILMTHTPKRFQSLIDSITHLIGLIISILMIWRTIIEGAALKELNITSSLLHVPVYPFYYIAAAGGILFCISIAAILINTINTAVKR